MPGLFSPDTDMFSTPPTTPTVPEEIRPSLSRRQSRPSSLRIQHSAVPDIILDHQTSPGELSHQTQTQTKGGTPLTATPALYSNGRNGSYANGYHTIGQSSSSSSQNIPHSPFVQAHGSSQQVTSTEGHPLRSPRPPSAMASPCFVHSQLQGPSVADWLQNNNQAKTNGSGLISGGQPYRAHYPDGTMSDYSYDGNEHHVQLDEDDSASSLTKHLAETAVGVREMSKQLGEHLNIYFRALCLNMFSRSHARTLRYPIHPHRHKSQRQQAYQAHS